MWLLITRELVEAYFRADNTVAENMERDEEPPEKRQKKTEKVTARGAIIWGRKIRNAPAKEQNEILRKCLGIHRHIYNECVDLEKKGKKSRIQCGRNAQGPRVIFSKKVNYAEKKSWKDELPTHLKQQAVAEYFRAK